MVLVLETEWGDLPFITDDGQFASLVVQLPAAPESGRTLALDGQPAMYRVGGQTLSYDTRTVQGTIEVLHADANRLVMGLDVVATAPSIDRQGVGDQVVKGRVEVPRSKGPSCRL